MSKNGVESPTAYVKFLQEEAKTERGLAKRELDALKGWKAPKNVRVYREFEAKLHTLRADRFEALARLVENVKKDYKSFDILTMLTDDSYAKKQKSEGKPYASKSFKNLGGGLSVLASDVDADD